ncbi:MAG: DUF3298 domain-containing protein [Lachnospiraceae bacterium]
MRNLKDAKNIYDHIVTPEELDKRLKETYHSASVQPAKKQPVKIVKFCKIAGCAAAALLICFTIGLNTSQVFARNMQEFPVLGNLARVLTVRSYTDTYDVTTTTLEVPEIQVQDTDGEAVAKAITDVNAEIEHIVNEYTNNAKEEIAEYKEAFMETGGTEEEWQERSIDVNVSYEIKCQNDTTLSLLLNTYTSCYNFSETRHFYNLDLITGKQLTLVDLLGEDAYEYASENVADQIEEILAADTEGQYVYWGFGNGADMEYTGVTEDTPFYINEAGNIVISFNKYDAAPGYMGCPEFEIVLK